MKIKSFQTENPADLIPESGKSLIGFHNGNFCYIKNDENYLRIRCHFERGNFKKYNAPFDKLAFPNFAIGKLLDSFNYDWKKATWLIHLITTGKKRHG